MHWSWAGETWCGKMRVGTIWVVSIPDIVFLQISNNCCWEQQSAFFHIVVFFTWANFWTKIPKISNAFKMKFARSSLEISGESTIFGQNYRSARNFEWGARKFHFGKTFGSEIVWAEKSHVWNNADCWCPSNKWWITSSQLSNYPGVYFPISASLSAEKS